VHAGVDFFRPYCGIGKYKLDTSDNYLRLIDYCFDSPCLVQYGAKVYAMHQILY
jgi:hypothetical protein